MSSDQNPQLTPEQIAELDAKSQEIADQYAKPMTPEETEALMKWAREQVQGGVVDYYPDDPNDPAMTPPPLDDNGDPIQGSH